jgi:hypothetical protein
LRDGAGTPSLLPDHRLVRPSAAPRPAAATTRAQAERGRSGLGRLRRGRAPSRRRVEAARVYHHAARRETSGVRVALALAAKKTVQPPGERSIVPSRLAPPPHP